MEYKLSQYNIKTIDERGNITLFNTLYGNIATFSNNKILYDNIERGSFDINSEDLNKLLSKGFILPKNIDEFNLASKMLFGRLDNSDTLLMTIMPTEKCNFRCIYCYENYQKGSMAEKTMENLILFIKLLLEKGNYKKLRVSWFGGEPLLEIEKILRLSEKLIQICKDKKIIYWGDITTNAYFLNLDNFKKLYYKARIYTYQITVDGVKNVHDINRATEKGEPTFDVITRNLRDIREYKQAKFFLINIRTNFIKDTLYNLDEFVEYLENEFGDDERFGVIWRRAFGLNDQCTIPPNVFNELISKYSNSKLRFVEDFLISYGGNGICYAARKNSFTIGSDGTIYKCTVHFDNPLNQLGNVNNIVSNIEDLIDLKKSYFWENRRIDSNMYKNQCSKCVFFPACMSCICPMNMYKNSTEIVCFKDDLETIEYRIKNYEKLVKNRIIL